MPLTSATVHGVASKGRLLRRVRRLGREDGNALIETAFVLPVVFLMTFGFIDFSLVLFGMGNANFASRAALRYATLHSNASYKPTTQQDLNSIVGSYIFRYPSNTWSVSSSYSSGNVVSSGVYITVTITYSFNAFGHIYSGLSYNSTGCGSVLQ